MTKEFLMRTLFDQYYDCTNSETADMIDAKFALCKTEEQERLLERAVQDSAEQAFTAGFNTALALMGHE